MKTIDHTVQHRYLIIPKDIEKQILEDPLCSNLFVKEIGYQEQEQIYSIPKNRQPGQYLIIYIVKGEGWYTYKEETYQVSENSFFVLPLKFIPVMESSLKNPWKMYWAIFSGSQAAKMTRFLMGEDYAPKKAIPLMGRVAQFNDILHHLEFMKNIENLVYANSRFYSFLCSFKLEILSAKKASENDRVFHTIEYMRENIDKVLTLEELADFVNFSVSHYCAVFKQKTTQTPIQFFTSMKVQRACQLLQNKEQTIKTIAYNLGFFDQYHFSKVFKQIMGTSPKKFRSRVVKD